MKSLGKSKKYKNVYSYKLGVGKDIVLYQGSVSINGVVQCKLGFTDERECAKWVDLQLIRAGKEPRNIFKRKS